MAVVAVGFNASYPIWFSLARLNRRGQVIGSVLLPVVLPIVFLTMV